MERGYGSDRCAAIIVYREQCTAVRSIGSIYCDYHRRLVRR